MRIEKPVSTLYNLLLRKAPVEAQLIVTRRCNLSCGYCSEFDNSSTPVALDDLKARIDALHRLKVAHITILGGEPLLHPQLAEIVVHGRRSSTVSITTNGFLLSDATVDRLNDAGLSHMQVSLDSAKVDPANFLQKTFKPLRPKLERLKARAKFDVHLAAVLCEQSATDVELLLTGAKEIGIPLSLSIVHDASGRCAIRGEAYLAKWEYYGRTANHFAFSMIDFDYGTKLLRGEEPAWKCRAGARSLYVDEFGNVQFCSGQRGRLNKPILDYTWDDVREQSETYKGCEAGCAIDCVFRASQVDNDRGALLRALVKGAFGRRNGVH